jgi:hypothetical protein
MSQTPPLPQITSVDSIPPGKTDPVVVSTSSDRLRQMADSDNSSKKNLVSDIPGQALPNTGTFIGFWDSNPIEDYTLSIRQWWEMVPDSYTKLDKGDFFKRSFTVSTGVSDSATQTLCAELGIEAEGLSAKISAEFSNTVVISSQNTVTEEHDYTNDIPNTVRVMALYQLKSELVALDSNGAVIPTSRGRKGEIEWFDDGGYRSGALLSYPVVQQTLPSIVTSQVSAYFPINS